MSDVNSQGTELSFEGYCSQEVFPYFSSIRSQAALMYWQFVD
jgi:hypothetical protein